MALSSVGLPLLCLLVMASCQSQTEEAYPANFQGNFDSSATYPDHTTEQYEEEDFGYEEQEGQEEEDILQFSENLGEFVADETFTFKLGANSQEKFLVWPGADVETVRGMFHCEVDWQEGEDYESGGHVDLQIEEGGSVVREYKKQRLGVFKQNYTVRDKRFGFVFRSGEAAVEVYFSYECVSGKKARESREGGNSTESPIEKVKGSFSRVSSLLEQQEREMKRLIEMGDRHTGHLEAHLSSLWWRASAETAALLASAFISLFLLKRELYAGYQQLV